MLSLEISSQAKALRLLSPGIASMLEIKANRTCALSSQHVSAGR